MTDLTWEMNPFGGAIVDPISIDPDPMAFADQLDRALKTWKIDDVKVAWLEILPNCLSAIPVAGGKGFNFHHADNESATMTLDVDLGAFVPPYATHYTGVGGVVINEDSEILVVSEKYRLGSRGPSYKLPGGALTEGENLASAAVREVEEETGIKTEFEAIVCFRHWHGYRYGKSDIYFVARLKPLSENITMQEEEIAECLWMPVDEFLSSNTIHLFNKTIVRAAILSDGVSPVEIPGYGSSDDFEFFMPPGVMT